MEQSIRVLHVDDEPGFAAMAADFLERENDRLGVLTATGPANGLEKLAQEAVDCIISDYDMPERDGLEFLRAVREDYPEVPFILFTGKGSEEVASDAISAGVTDYLQKQPQSEQFQLLANRVLEATEHRRSKISYREIFQKSPDGIVIHDIENGGFVDMNARYVDMFGYESKDEFMEAGFQSIHRDEPPYTLSHAEKQVQQAVENGAHSIEWPGVRKDGSQFWADVYLAPVRLHGHDRVLAAVRDVTDRRERQERLEWESARTEYALEATKSYIFEVDLESGEEHRMGQWEAIHGLPPEDAPTTESFIDRLVHPADAAAVRTAHEELGSTEGATARYEYRTHPEHGAVRWVRARMRVQSDPRSDAPRGIGLATDITELKLRQQDLERQNERLDQFARVLSHDLINPLTVAEGRLDLVHEEFRNEDTEAIERALHRIRELIEDLSEMARHGEPVLDPVPIALDEIAERCWKTVETGDGELVVPLRTV